MKKIHKEGYYSLWSAVMVLLLILLTAHFSSAQKYLPPPGKTLLVIGQDLASVSDYKNTPTMPALGGVTSYASLYDVANPSAYYPFGGLGEKLDGSVAPDIDWGAGPLNTHNAAYGFPEATLALGLYMTEDFFPGGLTQIANGAYDTEINRLATFLAATNKPVFLRIGYEFDGNWNTGYSNTTNYKNAYKHIVDLIRAKGTNTMMVLQACTSPVDDIIEGYHEDISQWYPGDDYVDYLGYSWFLNTPMQVSLTDELLALARLHNKPVMVCESTPQGYDLTKGTYRYINTMLGGAPGTNPVSKTPDQIWSEWFQPFFQYIHTNSDVIRIVAYINADWDVQVQWAPPYSQGYWGDSRVQANASIQQKWLTEVNTSFWLHGSSTLFNTLLNTGTTTTNNPPVVSFTNPTSATLNKGGTLYVNVNATDDDVVTGVTLSLNGTVVRKITTAPYTWGVSATTDPSLFNMAVGTYELKAVATDQNNHTTTQTFTVTVTDPATPPVVNPTTFAPANGKTLVLIGQTYRAEYDHYVSATNKAPAGSSHYAELYNGKIDQGDDSNNEAFLSYIDQAYPLAYAELGISMKDNPALGGYTGENAVWQACKDIPTGKWDTQIDMIAASMKSRPTIKFLVRIDYEVSLNMFANKTTTPFIDILNKYASQGINPLEHADQIPEFDLQAYKDAFNYIAQRIRIHNQVSNAAFIFHPVRGINDAKMLYPGDANVDWFGLSIFNHDVCWPTWEGATPPFRNCPETQALDDNVRQCMEWAKNTIKKPIIIAESASQSDVVNQNTAAFENGYLDKVFNLINTYDIKAFVYINSNWISHGWSSQWGDSRVEKDPAVLSHWLGEVLKPRYIHYPQVAPANDCAGVANGTAHTDACGVCVGGTTGKTTLDTDNDGTADCVDTDDDNDGVTDADDCAPLNAAIKGKTLWYADADGDGFGDASVSQLACTKPTGYVADKTDVCPSDPNKKVAGNCGCGKTEQSCLDCAGVANGTAKVDACGICTGGTTGKTTLDTDSDGTEDCLDQDDDNDGVADADDCAPLNAAIKGKTLWYADADGDGFGDASLSQLACTKPAGYVADKTDACPADPNKKVTGNCGCGKTEQSCLDCAGIANGTATLDNCQVCIGGTTGKQACTKDCHGDWGGTAVLDICNECAGGNTGITIKTSMSQCTSTGVHTSKLTLIKVYPNPFEDRVEITGIEEGEVEIYDASGKIVYKTTVTGDASISLSAYASGMYLLKYSTGDVQYQKVIIKK